MLRNNIRIESKQIATTKKIGYEKTINKIQQSIKSEQCKTSCIVHWLQLKRIDNR